jgi:hypothetical protein
MADGRLPRPCRLGSGLAFSPLCADHFPEPFLTGQGGQEHGQNWLSADRRDFDLTGWAEAIWDELDQLLEHTQCVKMSFMEAIQLFSVRIDGRVLSIDKTKEVPRHCSYPVWLSM